MCPAHEPHDMYVEQGQVFVEIKPCSMCRGAIVIWHAGSGGQKRGCCSPEGCLPAGSGGHPSHGPCRCQEAAPRAGQGQQQYWLECLHSVSAGMIAMHVALNTSLTCSTCQRSEHDITQPLGRKLAPPLHKDYAACVSQMGSIYRTISHAHDCEHSIV